MPKSKGNPTKKKEIQKKLNKRAENSTSTGAASVTSPPPPTQDVSEPYDFKKEQQKRTNEYNKAVEEYNAVLKKFQESKEKCATETTKENRMLASNETILSDKETNREEKDMAAAIVHHNGTMAKFSSNLLYFVDYLTSEFYSNNRNEQEIAWKSVASAWQFEQDHLKENAPRLPQDFANVRYDNFFHHAETYSNTFYDSNSSAACYDYAKKIIENKYFINHKHYMENGIFDLKVIKEFLRCHIPADSPLPNSEDDLVGLWIYFHARVLTRFMELQPVTSSREDFKNAVVFDEETYFHASTVFYFSKDCFDIKESELSQITEEAKCKLLNNPLALYKTLDNKNAESEKILDRWKKIIKLDDWGTVEKWKNPNKSKLVQDIIGLIVFLLGLANPACRKTCREKFEERGGHLLTTISCIATVKTDIDAIQYFYQHISEETDHDLYESMCSLFKLKVFDSIQTKEFFDAMTSQLEKGRIVDYVHLGHTMFYICKAFEATRSLNKAKRMVMTSKTKQFLPYCIAKENAIQQGLTTLAQQTETEAHDILIDIDLLLAAITDVKKMLAQCNTLPPEDGTATDKEIELALEKHKISLTEKRQEIQAHLSSLSASAAAKATSAVKKNSSTAERQAIIKFSEKKQFIETCSKYISNLDKGVCYLEAALECPESGSREWNKKIQQFRSAAGQVRSSRTFLADAVNSDPDLSLENSIAACEEEAAKKVSELLTKLVEQYNACSTQAEKTLAKTYCTHHPNEKTLLLKQGAKIAKKYMVLSTIVFEAEKLVQSIQNNKSSGGEEQMTLSAARLKADSLQRILHSFLMSADNKNTNQTRELPNHQEGTTSIANNKAIPTAKSINAAACAESPSNQVTKPTGDDIIKKYNQWISNFFSYKSNLIALFSEVEVLTSDFDGYLSDFYSRLEASKALLTQQEAQRRQMLAEFTSAGPGEDWNACKETLHIFEKTLCTDIATIDCCFQHLESIKQARKKTDTADAQNPRMEEINLRLLPLTDKQCLLAQYMTLQLTYNESVTELEATALKCFKQELGKKQILKSDKINQAASAVITHWSTKDTLKKKIQTTFHGTPEEADSINRLLMCIDHWPEGPEPPVVTFSRSLINAAYPDHSRDEPHASAIMPALSPPHLPGGHVRFFKIPSTTDLPLPPMGSIMILQPFNKQ